MTSTYPRPPIDAVWEAENNFYLNGHPSRIGKLLAHYEIYQKIADLPGAVVECGVFKGASLMRFASFRHYLENATSRPIIGFDAFGHFPQEQLQTEDDRAFAERFEGSSGVGILPDTLNDCLSDKGFGNVQLIGGDVLETVDAYLEKNLHLRVALLHLDMDVYKPTQHCLERFYDRLVPGGVVVIDDYGTVGGASQATDEFIARHGLMLAKTRFYTVPAYFVKPA